jgi:integrase
MGALKDIEIKNLKPRDRAYQIADGGGLVLEVRPGGQRAWLYRYRLYGRQEKLSVGSYPEVSLKQARIEHEAARAMVRQGKSPAHAKQAEKQRLSDDLQIVRGLAKAYIEDHLSSLASAKQSEKYVRKEILPAIGNKFSHEVTPADCVAIVERIKRRSAPAVARKVLEQLRGLFAYAVDRHLLTVNPASQVRAAKVIGVKGSRENVLSAKDLRRYLRAAGAFPTSQANQIAFKLILLTLCRKGELVKAKKKHVDLKNGQWLIPAENAKNRREHIVYLSTQARALFEELIALAGRSEWLLPGRDPATHINVNTLNQVVFVAKNREKALEWLGKVWIHDLRRTASTMLHEMGWVSDVIEKALNHTIAGDRGIYNRAKYAAQRKEMLQAWADFVDGVLDGGEVVPIRKAS